MARMMDHTIKFRNGEKTRKHSRARPPINATRTSVSQRLDNGRCSGIAICWADGFIGLCRQLRVLPVGYPLAKLTGHYGNTNRAQVRNVQTLVPTRDSLPVTPRELTSALYEAGSLQRGSVVEVAIEKQIETPISHLWFLAVVYEAESLPALPDRLLLKWAIDESPAPERGEPELVFYRELAPSLTSPPM